MKNFLVYFSRFRKSLVQDYRVITAPPPSSGPAFILALNILEGFNFTKDDINNPLFWHRFIEVRLIAINETEATVTFTRLTKS